MKNEEGESIKKIIERRIENEGEEEVICIKEVNQNINRIMTNQPLTRPLRALNKSCNFRKKYEEVFNYAHEENLKEEVKQKNKEYQQKPEVKKKRREYSRIRMRNILNIPESKWRI